MVSCPRAYRRAHLARMKAKARKVYPHDPHATNANHLAQCSCYMCGNPRKWFKERPLREQRQLLAMDQQERDL